MDCDRLTTFRDIAHGGSIAAAARATGRDPSVLSRSLGALESELGVRLVQRTTRRFVLTEAGERFLSRVEAILDDLAAAREDARGAEGGRPSGRLRVTASSSFGQVVLGPLIARFLAEHPAVDLDLLLTDAVVDLVAEGVDLAVRLGPRPGGELVAALVRTVPMRLVASPTCLRNLPAIAVPDDLARLRNLIATSRPPATWLFRRDGGATEEVSVRGRVVTTNTLVARRLALDGLGLAVLADWLVAEDLAAGRLVLVLPEWEAAVGAFGAGVWLAYPSRRFLPLKTRAFIEFLRRGERGGGVGAR